MKHIWEQPKLDVLNVKMTMGSNTGDFTDVDIPQGTPKDQVNPTYGPYS